MVIDKGKLIALLVEKTGSSNEEVERKLDELITGIREAARSNREFHINNFGTFSTLDGRLRFVPTSQLKTEINQKYAGMKPIELMEAFKKTGAGVPLEDSSPGAAVPEPPSEKTADTEPPLKEAEWRDEQPPDQPDEIQPDNEEEEGELPLVPLSEEQVPAEDSSPVASSDQNKETPEQTDGPVQWKPFEYDQKGNNKSKASAILLFATVLIAILLGGWILYNSGIFGPKDDRYESNEADQNAIEAVPPLLVPADSVEGSTSVRDTADKKMNSALSQNDNQKAVYGLKGSVNNQVENAYTIVIHSFRLESTVQEIADSLDREQYRTVLLAISAESGARWQLGLGQFETSADAQKAAQSLPSPYKENHIIKQIRSDNP